MQFCRQHNLNAYIYAPKDDPYHREKWRVAYPTEKVAELEKLVATAKENGVRFIFTGHTHMTNIAVKHTEKGNDIYDINTGSLVTYPLPYRKMELTDTELKITTLQVDDFDWDFGGNTALEYTKAHFNGFLNDIFDSAAYDIDRLAVLGNAFSMKPETIYKFEKPITYFGKKMQTFTIGQLGKLLGVGKKIEPSVKDIRLKDFCIEIIDNVFHGDEPYTPDTPMYRSVSAIVNRIIAILKPIPKTKGVREILVIFRDGVLYDAPPADWNVTLKR